MVTKSKRISNILQKELLEKTNTMMYFDSNAIRDEIKGMVRR